MSQKPKVSFKKPPGASAGAVAQADSLRLSRAGDVAIELDISLIDFDPDQHRQDVKAPSIKEMAASITVNGVLQAIVVRPANAAGRYKLVIGERRVRGSMLAGKPTIPALVRAYTDLEADVAQVVENAQREGVNPLHTARKLRRMLNKHKHPDGREMEHTELALLIGKGETYVSQHLRLLDLPPSVAALAENTVLRDVDTLTNIAKLFEVDQPAAVALVGKAEAGQKVTRAESSGALRDAKAKRKAGSAPARDPRTVDFIEGKSDAAAPRRAGQSQSFAARSKAFGLEIAVAMDRSRDPLTFMHFMHEAGDGRALIDFAPLIEATPGSFNQVDVYFERTGVTWDNVPLSDLLFVSIGKL